MSETIKATHRHVRDHEILYGGVGSVVDRCGYVSATRLFDDGSTGHRVINPDDLEPIPQKQKVPFDYESWLELLCRHEVLFRHKASKRTTLSPCFDDSSVSVYTWAQAQLYCEYSTDFGDSWLPMEREVEA